MSAGSGFAPRRLLAPIDASLAHLALSPAAGSSDGQPPAVLLLHGRGADERDLVGLAGAFDPRLLVVSARAPLSLGWGFQWYELVEVGTPGPAGFARSLDLLHRFVPEIVAGYGIDPARLVLLGFSQGAVMSAAVALSRPDLAAGAVLLSGYLPPTADLEIDESAVRGFPFFVGHGTDDPLIPISWGRQAREELSRLGTDVAYREYPIAHQISESELAELSGWVAKRALRADADS
jgi:phospholipase/carboxylesterase